MFGHEEQACRKKGGLDRNGEEFILSLPNNTL